MRFIPLPVVITNLTHGGSASAGPWTSASIAPALNSMLILSVHIINGSSTNPANPTISWNGLTWTLVDSILEDNNSTSRKKLFVYTTIVTDATAGGVTITPGASNVAGDWSIEEAKVIDISGTVVQHTTASQLTAPTVSSLTATLSGFASPNNATFAAFAAGGDDTVSVGSGFSLLANEKTSGRNLVTEWKNTADTSVDFSLGIADYEIGMVALEIKAYQMPIPEKLNQAVKRAAFF